MPSTYTTNLGIEKPATGEQSGTWGDTVNLNYDLFDQAINGVQSVTLAAAGSSGSPRVLAITDGTVSEGRNKFIEFVDGGDLGATAYVQLTPNNAEKIVHFRNSLSANRSVIVFQGTYNASNDFEIPNGKDVVLKFDGAGSGAVVADVFVDLQVTGLTAGTADINGGTLDGVTIGGASAGAGTFTSLKMANGNARTIEGPDAASLVINHKADSGGEGLIIQKSGTEQARISVNGTLLIGGTTQPANATGGLVLFNKTIPFGSVTDGVILYSEDVASSAELKVRDEAGNVTTLSPHNFSLIPEGPSEDMAWGYYSERDGKKINVDMLKALRILEQLSGEKLVYEEN